MSKNIFDSILNPNMVDFALIEVDDNGNDTRVMPDEYITRHMGATWTLYSFDILKGTVNNRRSAPPSGIAPSVRRRRTSTSTPCSR